MRLGICDYVSKQKSNLQTARETFEIKFNLAAAPMICYIISLNRVISASHWSNNGLQNVVAVTLPLSDTALMKQLQTVAPVPTHEISHKDHLVPENFHGELINCVLDVLINNHFASLCVLICLPHVPALNNH